MKCSPKYTISTAKFTQQNSCIETTTSFFDTSALQIQQLYDQIDELIAQLNKRIRKPNKQDNNIQITAQKGMIQADEESIQLQQTNLAIELEQLQDLINDDKQDSSMMQAHLKRQLQSLQNAILIQKQTLPQIDCQLKEFENRQAELQEKQQSYATTLLKFKEKIQQFDSIDKLLDQNGHTHWIKLKQLFDVEIIKSSVPMGQIIRLQMILLRELENMIQQDPKSSKVQEEKKQLLIEINTQNPLVMLSLSFDQLVLNVVHQPKDNSIPKSGIMQQLSKCITQMHQLFCQLAQQLNKQNLSYRLFDEGSKELGELHSEIKSQQQRKSQILIEIDKNKRKLKDLQSLQQQRQFEIQAQIESESQNLLTMYMKDKENLMRDIKFKYGKAYHDHMIMDVKMEFKNICLTQYQNKIDQIEQAFIRIEQIKKLMAKNKDKMQQLHLDHLINNHNNNNNNNNNNNKDIGEPIAEKTEYILQLQNLKIQLLQFENKIQRKQQIDNDMILNDISQKIEEIQIIVEQEFQILKNRSDSIDTVKRVRAPEHGRTQSQVPAICVQLLDLQLPVNNPKELFESSEDPIKSSKKTHSEWSSYQLSFNQNPLKSISNISGGEHSFNTQNQSSMRGSILEEITNKKQELQTIQSKQQQWNMLVFLQLEPTNKQYDPIKNFNEDPKKFGFDLYRLDDEFNVFSGKNDSYNQLKMKLQVKSFVLDHCSESAIRFQKIYEPSIRNICQDSLALRHLNVRYFPFTFIGTTTIKGLSLNESDLVQLQKCFK